MGSPLFQHQLRDPLKLLYTITAVMFEGFQMGEHKLGPHDAEMHCHETTKHDHDRERADEREKKSSEESEI